MVVVLILLTVTVFLVIDYILRREGKAISEIGQEKRSPIFLSPEKSLTPVGNNKKRFYHLSHSWVQPSDEDYVYVGFDDFVAELFTSEVQMSNLPLVGAHIPQGIKIWDVGLVKHKVSQLSPVSGKVVDVNPACRMSIPLPSEDVKKSWILKLKADDLENESHNLMKESQAKLMNTALHDELLMYAQEGHYLNDGGKIDPAYIENMPEEDWQNLISKYFPFQL